MNDSISSTKAREIDIEWMKAGMPDTMLRIVGYRIAGNRSRTYLTVPGDDAAPCYVARSHNPDTGEYAPAYYHVSGPTLDEWQEQERLERDARNEYREAAELYAWASGR